MFGARVAVRLEENQHAVKVAPTRGFESGANLSGVVAVIVDDGDVIDHAFHVKSAADSRKFFEAHANQFGRHVEVTRDRDRGGSVAHIMDSRRAIQMELSEVVAAIAVALYLNVPSELIRVGLEEFA